MGHAFVHARPQARHQGGVGAKPMSYRIEYPKARLSPAKDGLVVFEFARRHIENGDTTEIRKALSPMAATRENAQLYEAG